MQIQMLTTWASPAGLINAGQKTDVEKSVAEALIKTNQARSLEKVEKEEAVETRAAKAEKR